MIMSCIEWQRKNREQHNFWVNSCFKHNISYQIHNLTMTPTDCAVHGRVSCSQIPFPRTAEWHSMEVRSGGNEADSVSFRLITSEYAFKGPWGYKESFEETDRGSCSPGTLASKSALSHSHLRLLFRGGSADQGLNWKALDDGKVIALAV